MGLEASLRASTAAENTEEQHPHEQSLARIRNTRTYQSLFFS